MTNLRAFNESPATGRCATCDQPYSAHTPGATPLIMLCPDPVEVRQPKDTAGETLVPGTVYRFTTPSGAYPFFAIYVDAVVEDDDSLTLVVELANGDRNGLSAARNRVLPIVPQSCGGLGETHNHPTDVGGVSVEIIGCPGCMAAERDPIDEVEAYRG